MELEWEIFYLWMLQNSILGSIPEELIENFIRDLSKEFSGIESHRKQFKQGKKSWTSTEEMSSINRIYVCFIDERI